MFNAILLAFTLSANMLCANASGLIYHTNNGIYQDNSSMHTIMHEPQGTVHLYHNRPEVVKSPNRFLPQIFISAGLGAHYIYSQEYSYTDGGTISSILDESYTHTVLPVGVEILFPTKNRTSFGFGANYYFNPLTNSSELKTTGVKVFTAKTKYLVYGKASFTINDILSLSTLLGISGFNLSVYNDITNTLFSQSKVNAPAAGLGLSLNATPNIRMFIDGIYSYIGNANANYNGTNPRLKAISERKYHSFQGRVGIAFNLASLQS